MEQVVAGRHIGLDEVAQYRWQRRPSHDVLDVRCDAIIGHVQDDRRDRRLVRRAEGMAEVVGCVQVVGVARQR